MNRQRVRVYVLGLMLIVPLLIGCVTLPTSTPIPPTATATPVPPTATLVPPTAAAVPPTATATRVQSTAMPTIVAGTMARQHLVALSETIGQRVAGTPNETKAAQYIDDAFKQIGYLSSIQSFSATVTRNKGDVTIKSANVVALKPGVSAQEIIVGAHYDSVSQGNGADDNASGIAVMLEVASRIKDKPTPYTIRFVAFGAEEDNQKGSSYYVSQMSQKDIQNTIAMINLDSLIAGDIAYVYGSAGNKGFIRDWALAMAQKEGLALRTQMGGNPKYPAGTTGDWSDHAPFDKIGIPYGYLESTNWSLGEKDGYTQVDTKFGEKGEIWHTKYDSLAYVDNTFPGRVDERLKLFVTVLYNIATQFKKLE